MVKIHDALNASCSILKKAVPFARHEAEIIVSHVLGTDKLQLIVKRDSDITKEDYDKIIEFSNRRKNGEPMAYVTGIKEFMSLEFSVNENVLIPRPETEELVSLIIEESENDGADILDLCTGSGAICCSLAYYLKTSRCTGVDVSPKALEVAAFNSSKLGTSKNTGFICADVLQEKDFGGRFDIVVSNPPYIESAVIPSLDTGVKDFEPLIALDGGCDGLEFYRKITENAPCYLKNGGMLYFEIGYNQGEAVKKLMENSFACIRVIKDIGGNDRIVCGKLKTQLA